MKSKATWHLNRNCNFDCSYCYVRHFKRDEPGHDFRTDLKAFRRNDIEWECINLSGGEPFVYPHFVDLCRGLTNMSKIIVTTNLSTSNVLDFADTIDPRKVELIHASVHIGQRKNYSRMIEYVKYLKERDFNVWVSQVAHPSLLSQYDSYYKMFQKNGIKINPKAFEGVFHMREYPQAYTEAERRFILKKVEEDYEPTSTNVHKYSQMLWGSHDWKGLPCSAGHNNMQIQYTGDAYRCHGDRRYLGNLYKGDITLDSEPNSCTSDCSCENEGWYGHDSDGYIQTGQDLKKIIKAYAVATLSRVGWKP